MKIPIFIVLSLLALFAATCKKDKASTKKITGRMVPGLPAVASSSITNIGNTSAIFRAEVLEGTDRRADGAGVCWDTVSHPTLFNHNTHSLFGEQSIFSELTNLKPFTKYFARAYLSNSIDTIYGD